MSRAERLHDQIEMLHQEIIAKEEELKLLNDRMKPLIEAQKNATEFDKNIHSLQTEEEFLNILETLARQQEGHWGEKVTFFYRDGKRETYSVETDISFDEPRSRENALAKLLCKIHDKHPVICEWAVQFRDDKAGGKRALQKIRGY